MGREYVDVREIHPEFAKAACKHCDVENYGRRGAVEKYGHTFCKDHNPLGEPNYPARGHRGEWVETPYVDEFDDAVAFALVADKCSEADQ